MRSRAQISSLISKHFPNFYNGDPFPPHMRRELTYSSGDYLTAGASALVGTTKVFSLNSLFDPDNSGVGHQPYGYDQLCTSSGPYMRYKVLNTKVEVIVTTGTACWLCIAVHNPSTSATISGLDLAAVKEKHNTKVVFIPSTGGQQKIFQFDLPQAALHNWTKLQFDSESANVTGAYNSNPGSQPLLELGCVDPGGSTPAIYCQTTLKYDTDFYARAQLTQS
jgi:hypothetical protein